MTLVVYLSCRRFDWPRIPETGSEAVVMSGGAPMTILRATEDTSEAELLAWLHECSRYPQSAERTASCDVLLDLLNAWAGVE